jgi:hypothetical protein
MSQTMQRHFKDLPEPIVGISSDNICATAPPPILTSVSAGQSFLKQEMFCSPIDLDIKNATLQCVVLRLEKELLLKTVELDEKKNIVSTLEENLLLESQSRQTSEENNRILLEEQLKALAVCQQDLSNSEERYEKICEQEKGARELCDKLVSNAELSATSFQTQSDALSSTIRENDIEKEKTERKLSEALSEKAIVEESFRLFKNSILTDLDNEGGDDNLMMKIRLLQESNAQLAAEVKSLSRKCIDADVEVAAAKEELSLSDRMKLRLSSSMDTQCREMEVLEKKLLRAHEQALQEQAAREQLAAAGKTLEMQAIQAKFVNERQEHVILDLKETNESLQNDLADEKLETKRWIDRLKNVEQSTRQDQEKSQREYAASFEREMQSQQERLALREEECVASRASLHAAALSLQAAREEGRQLQGTVASLEAQVLNLSELEGCISEMQADLENKEDEIATLCQAFEKRGEVLKELEKRISLQASEISFLRPERDSKAKIAKDFEAQLTVLQKEKAELLRVSSQNDNRGAVIDELKMTVMQYEQKLKDIVDDKDQLKHCSNELDVLKTAHRVLKNDYEEAEDTIVELSRAAADEIQQREEQLAGLRKLAEERGADGTRMREEIRTLKTVNTKLEKQITDAASSMFGFRSNSDK